MGVHTGSTDGSGTLVDNGGPDGNYSNSSYDTFLIESSEGGVQIDFTEFDVEFSSWSGSCYDSVFNTES